MRRYATLGAALLVGLACSANLQAEELLVPGPASTTVEGGSSNTIPFGSDFDFGARFQQVWDGSVFGSVPGTFTSVGWRRDGSFNDSDFGTFTALSYTMTLSTTSAGPGSLSETFADNVGADATVVYSGPVTIELTGAPGEPNEFATLTLDTPFSFDPSAGNLLMEIGYVGNPSGVGSIDTYTDGEASGVTSRLFRVFQGVNAETGIASTEFSPVVQFGFIPVPEPASTAACLLAIGVGVLRRRA